VFIAASRSAVFKSDALSVFFSSLFYQQFLQVPGDPHAEIEAPGGQNQVSGQKKPLSVCTHLCAQNRKEVFIVAANFSNSLAFVVKVGGGAGT